MYTEEILYAIPLLVGTTVALAFCFLALQRYREPGALAFVAGMGSVGLWSFAYAFELLSPTLPEKMLWHRLIYSTSSAVPAFWLLFLLQHEYNNHHRIRYSGLLLMIEPVVYTFLTWTNGYLHNWLWRRIDLVTIENVEFMVIERSLGFYIHVAFTYLLVFLSVLFFLRMLRRESSTLALWQVILLTLGVLAPIIANTLHIFSISPVTINLTPFALISMGMAGGWFAFRFDLWDLLPAAHDAVFAGMADGVIVLTLNQVVIEINPAAYRLLELPKHSHSGRRLHDIVTQHPYFSQLLSTITAHPVDTIYKADATNQKERFVGTFGANKDTQQSATVYRQLVGPTAQDDDRTPVTKDYVQTIGITVNDTVTRYLDVVVSPLRDRRERLTGQILILRDVTTRYEMEQALQRERTQLAKRVEERTQELSQANAELARAARLKDEFLANMSHELRTPLNAVLGLADALEDGVYGTINERQTRALRHILESGRHLLALINDILDVSKIEAGKLNLEFGPIAVDSLCESSVNFVKQSAAKKQLQIRVDVDPQVHIVIADERRLKQILVNLLNNAVKFTPEHGTIGIQVVGDPMEEITRFAVWDTGVGIAAEDMAELFKPFVQLDSQLNRAHEGTGLGLALVQRMVDLHGGSITVESTPGRGSKFIVAIPWLEERLKPLADQIPVERVVPSTPAANAVAATPPRILIVEDNEINITTFADYLAVKGYKMFVARSGGEALSCLPEVLPDLILLDIQMPGMDGLEVAQRIRAGNVVATVPIIALTALAMPGDRERCLATGMNDYLSKPVNMRRLHQVIAEHLDPSMILADSKEVANS